MAAFSERPPVSNDFPVLQIGPQQGEETLTVQTQPDGTLEPHEGEDGQANPETGLCV